ncbi:MAG: type II secretion system protein GspM [Pseudomonadota bacterium]
MKDWFLKFSLRDQLALLVLAVAVLLYALVFLVLEPMNNARVEARNRKVAYAEQLARVDTMASELAALRARGGTGNTGARRNLTSLLNRTAQNFELQISRLQPNSRGAVQLRFESVPLAGLLRYLHELETGQDLIVEELSISQTGTAGYVSATVRLASVG